MGNIISVCPQETEKMFCLRSWLPLLFIDERLADIHLPLLPLHILPESAMCLLLVPPPHIIRLSCHWSDHCFFDFSSNWFEPRQSPAQSAELMNSTLSNPTMDQLSMYVGAFNNTAVALAGTVLEEAKRQLAIRTEWTGIGVDWLRSLLGRREWRLPCVDVYIRL